MEKRQRTRLASAGVLAVVFASGALVGMAVDRSLTPDQGLAQAPAETPQDSSRFGGPGGRGGRGNRPQRRFFYEQVGLSAEELAAADSLYRVHRVAVEQIERQFRREADSILDASGRRQQFREDIGSAMQTLRSGIRSLMTTDQLVVYDSLLAADEQRRQAEEERRRSERGGQRSGNRPN
jgi:hypothetical protein